MNLIKNSFLYSFVALLQKAFSFLLLPLYTIFLLPSDYGIIAVVTSFISILSLFFSLSLHGAVSRFYYEYNSDEDKKTFIGTLTVFTLILSTILGFLIISFGEVIFKPILKNIAFYPYVILGVASCIFTPVYQLYQTFLQVRYEAKKFSINGLVYFFTNTGLCLFLVVALKLKADGVLLAQAITSLIFFVFALLSIKRYAKVKIDFEMLKKALRYSIPLVPHSLSGWIMSFLDRIFVNGIINTTSAGLFSVGSQLASVVGIANYGVTQAYSPWLMELLSKDSSASNLIQYKRFSLLGMALLNIIALGLSLFSPFLIHLIFPRQYQQAYIVVPLIAFGSVFNGLYTFNIGGVFYKKSYLVPIVTFTASIVSMLLNIILIKKYGFFGASVANLVANIVSAIIAIFIGKKTLDLHLPHAEHFAITIAALLLSLIPLFVGVSLIAFFALGFLFLLYLSFVFLRYRGIVCEFLKKGRICHESV